MRYYLVNPEGGYVAEVVGPKTDRLDSIIKWRGKHYVYASWMTEGNSCYFQEISGVTEITDGDIVDLQIIR